MIEGRLNKWREQDYESLSRFCDLLQVRHMVGDPSPEEVEKITKSLFVPLKTRFTGNIVEREKTLLEAFSLSKESESCLQFCVSNILGIREYLINSAETFAGRGSMEKFRFYFDVASGMSIVKKLIHAENELSDVGEENVFRTVAHYGKKFNLSENSTLQNYLYIKKINAESLKLLLKDNSGILLIDTVINKIKSSSREEISPLFGPYLSSGAELAEELYKKLYQMISPLK